MRYFIAVIFLAFSFGSSCGGEDSNSQTPTDAQPPSERLTDTSATAAGLAADSNVDCSDPQELAQLTALLLPLPSQLEIRSASGLESYAAAHAIDAMEAIATESPKTTALHSQSVAETVSPGTIKEPAMSAVAQPRVPSPSLLDSLEEQELLNRAELDSARLFVRRSLIGGNPVDDKDNNPYPWAAVLVMVRGDVSIPFCSGALVAPRLMLTAAHCAIRFKAGDVVFVGGTNLETDPGQPRFVNSRAIHQCFDQQKLDHDIALLQLDTDVEVQPLALAQAGTNADQRQGSGTIVAWGHGAEPETLEVKQLQDLNVSLVDNSACASFFPSTRITSQMLCAGAFGATTCYGDSGGALVVQVDNHQEVIGTASFTGACIEPGVFSRISAYAGWLGALVGS